MIIIKLNLYKYKIKINAFVYIYNIIYFSIDYFFYILIKKFIFYVKLLLLNIENIIILTNTDGSNNGKLLQK